MSNYNPAGGGLQYRGTAANQPPNCIFDNRDPTQYDTQGVSLLDLWLNTVSGTVFCLVSLAGNSTARRSLAIWAPIGSRSGDLFALRGNTGGSVSATFDGIIDIIGATPITVTGNPATNTLTISIAVATTSSQGSVQLSDDNDTIAGTSTNTAVTPDSLKAKLGTQTNDGVAYGDGTSNAILWTAAGANDTVLTGTGSAPVFASEFTVGNIILNNFPGSPTADNVATVGYVDAIAAGFTFIAAVRLATTADLGAVTYANGAAGVGATLTNNDTQVALSIDGVATAPGDRVLIKNETSQEYNGIYDVTDIGSGATDWVLTRSADYDQAPAEIKPGNIVPVTAGNTNANTLWLQTATVTTIGTDPIIFIPFGVQPVSPLPIAQGGTNTTSFSEDYGTVYFDSVELATVDPGTAGQVLTSNGPGVAPSYQSSSGSGGVIVTIYNVPGPFTWTPDPSTNSVEIYGFGGGGGGGYGGNPLAGSGGGGGGGCFYYSFPIGVLSPPVSGVVGAGGAGGTIGSQNGGDGQPSSFGNYTTGGMPFTSFSAYGGTLPLSGGGRANGRAAGGFVMTMTNTLGFFNASVLTLNTGGYTDVTGSGAPNNSWGNMLPTGGGDAGTPVKPGGSILHPVTSAVIVAGGTAGTSISPNGGNGNTSVPADNIIVGGTGGGGGFGTGTGGNGADPGGGGGAGGKNGGNGGSGGDGTVIVIEYT